MRDGANTDKINSSLCDRGHGAQRHAATGFELHAWRHLIAQGDGLAQQRQGHIVQQNGVHFCGRKSQ